ncbi:hypothetical protein HDU84_004817 [Entophlyctis sp. JEL0112]|nr:hypothetical protein HDU84_004817 [Entophlyctis sp. JEL0112]
MPQSSKRTTADTFKLAAKSSSRVDLRLAEETAKISNQDIRVEEVRPLSLAAKARVFVFSAFPIVATCIVAALLYLHVDESQQTVLLNSRIIPKVMVNGSGSPLLAPAYWRLIDLFNQTLNEPDYSVSLEYLSSSSAAGRLALLSGSTLFAVTDTDVTDDEAIIFINSSNPKSGVYSLSPQHYGALLMPLAAGAIAVVYNIPGSSTASLTFDASLLQNIFTGSISLWNDSLLQALNPNTTLPGEKFTLIVSTDSADLFQSYLRAKNSTFSFSSRAISCANPVESMYVAASVPYSITYTSLEAAQSAISTGHTVGVASIVNIRGEITQPTKRGVAAAMNAAVTSAFKNSTTALLRDFVSLLDVDAAGAYPLSFLSYALIRENYFYFSIPSDADCVAIKDMTNLIYFSITSETVSNSLLRFGWVPPNNLLQELNLNALASVTCNKRNILMWINQDEEMDLYLSTGNSLWEQSLSFWSNLSSLSTTTVGMSFYLVFYILLILSNSIPFVANMAAWYQESKHEPHSKNVMQVKWTMQNFLGIVTQLIQQNTYVDIVSYIGLMFDWFWYCALIYILVCIWLACMYYTTFLYNFLETHYPQNLQHMTKFHAFLSDFMPNFALIFFNPSVELFAKVFDCRLSQQTLIYTNVYGQTCWQTSHWITTTISLVLACAFTNNVVRYCKILKLLRKEFTFKDADWNIFVESVFKTVLIILHFNVPNAAFLACAAALMAGMSLCSLIGRPNYVAWFDWTRGALYAYCSIIAFILCLLEFIVPFDAYGWRMAVSPWLSLSILALTSAVSLSAYIYAMIQFRSGVTDAEKKKQAEELKKFFAAFGDDDDLELQREADFQSIVLDPRLSDKKKKHRSANIDFEHTNMNSYLLNPLDLHHSVALQDIEKWQKLEELMVKAEELGYINSEELASLRDGVKFEDPIIPMLYSRSNKDLKLFAELMKRPVHECFLDHPRAPSTPSTKRHTVRSFQGNPSTISSRPESLALNSRRSTAHSAFLAAAGEARRVSLHGGILGDKSNNSLLHHSVRNILRVNSHGVDSQSVENMKKASTKTLSEGTGQLGSAVPKSTRRREKEMQNSSLRPNSLSDGPMSIGGTLGVLGDAFARRKSDFTQRPKPSVGDKHEVNEGRLKRPGALLRPASAIGFSDISTQRETISTEQLSKRPMSHDLDSGKIIKSAVDVPKIIIRKNSTDLFGSSSPTSVTGNYDGPDRPVTAFGDEIIAEEKASDYEERNLLPSTMISNPASSASSPITPKSPLPLFLFLYTLLRMPGFAITGFHQVVVNRIIIRVEYADVVGITHGLLQITAAASIVAASIVKFVHSDSRFTFLRKICVDQHSSMQEPRRRPDKPIPRPQTPFGNSNSIRLEALSRWLQGLEDSDSFINKSYQSCLKYPKENEKKKQRIGIQLVRLDPRKQHPMMKTKPNCNTGKNTFELNNDHEQHFDLGIVQAIKRTRFLLSRLGSSQRCLSADGNYDQEEHHDPLFDWHLRPASSHHHPPANEVPQSLNNRLEGILHQNDRTANPLLKIGWTWREIPLATSADFEKCNAESLINRGFVPQGSDLSFLVKPIDNAPIPFIRISRSKLHQFHEREKYSAFDLPVAGRSVYTQTRKLEPLPDIARDTKLQAAIVKALDIQPAIATTSKLVHLAYPPPLEQLNLIKFKPQCPIAREVEPQHDVQKNGARKNHYLLAPPGSRQPSASAFTVRTDPSSNWTIFVKAGSVTSTSDAFINFREKNIEIWPQIRYYIWKIEILMRRYAVPCAEIRCQELINLAVKIPASAEMISWESLGRLLYNSEEIFHILRTPGQVYKGSGHESNDTLAAKRIQNVFMAHRSRMELKNYSKMIKSAVVMIKAFRVKNFRHKLYQSIRERFRRQHKPRFYEMMAQLQKESKVKEFALKDKAVLAFSPRYTEIDVIDHITGRLLELLENSSITLLVLIVPLLNKEKEEYISCQLDIGFPDMNPLRTGRLKMLVPEAAKCFLPGSSVSAMLMASYRTMSQVKSLFNQRFAFILSDFVGHAEITLSSLLGIPIYGARPEKARTVNTRHKTRLFLKHAGIEPVPGMSFRAGTELKLKEALLHANALFPNMPAWEVTEKRDFRFLDFARADYACDALIRGSDIPPISENSVFDEIINSFELHSCLLPTKCPSHAEFINHVCGLIGPKFARTDQTGTGGFIQARPVLDGKLMRRVEIGYFLEYSGHRSQLITAEAMYDSSFEQIGLIVPQQILPHSMIAKLVDRLSANCLKTGIYGHVSLQLSVWFDSDIGKHRWWANNFYAFLSPTLLKAASVLVTTGCPIEMKSGSARFSWNDIPLHLEKTQNAIFADRPQIRVDFESDIKKQAGGPIEKRVALYIDALRSEEVDRLTWRGFNCSCQRDGLVFNEKARIGCLMPMPNPLIPMMMPLIVMAAEYKSAIELFLNSLVICHRKLNHYDIPDLVSNLKDIGLTFLNEWETLESSPESRIAVKALPEFSNDAYATIFSSLKKAEFGGSSSAPNLSNHFDAGILVSTRRREQEDGIITSESENSCGEEAGRQITSTASASAIHRVLISSGQRSSRIADRRHFRSWWDTPLFRATHPETGEIYHIDPYDPMNPSNTHFELDTAKNPVTAKMDLEAEILRVIQHLPISRAKQRRPTTSCAKAVQRVFDSIALHRRPPPPPKAQRSTLSISLLNEGIPSVVAAKFDPTFRKPLLAPAFKSTPRYLRIRRGEYSPKDQAKVEAALTRFESEYEDRMLEQGEQPGGNETDSLMRTKENNGSLSDEGDEDSSERDLAIQAAFELMNQVNAKESDAAPSNGKSDVGAKSSGTDQDAMDMPAKSAHRRSRRKPIDTDQGIHNALEKMAKLSERAGDFETKFESLQAQQERKRSVLNSTISVDNPAVILETSVRLAAVPDETSGVSSVNSPIDSTNKQIPPEIPSIVHPEQSEADASDLSQLRLSTGVIDLRRQMSSERISTVMEGLVQTVNRTPKEERVKSMFGSVFALADAGEEGAGVGDSNAGLNKK